MNKNCFDKDNLAVDLADVSAETLLNEFGKSLLAEGYSTCMSRVYVSAASHLFQWATRRGTMVGNFNEDVRVRFVRHLSRCHCHAGKRADCRRVPFRVGRFLLYLREVGMATQPAPEPAHSPLTEEYRVWMHAQRGLAGDTIRNAMPVVGALLTTVADAPCRLDASTVRQFVLQHIQHHATASAGSVTSIVRCFLRWLVTQGRCSTDLTAAVPKVPTWRLAKLPPYLADSNVEHIIEACNRPSGMAQRDRAMLLLLACLGLRASEVVALRMGDFDWKNGRICVVGKSRHETRLPLPQDAGDAVLKYIQTERRATATDYVFLRARAPIRPISVNGLRDVVRRLIQRTGVQTPSRGTHILRHSLAKRLLHEGATIDTIGAVLRHCDVNTTAIYAKVDVDLLRKIAQPWPGAEVSSC
jgi:integrase/recombinase XerD